MVRGSCTPPCRFRFSPGSYSISEPGRLDAGDDWSVVTAAAQALSFPPSFSTVRMPSRSTARQRHQETPGAAAGHARNRSYHEDAGARPVAAGISNNAVTGSVIIRSARGSRPRAAAPPCCGQLLHPTGPYRSRHNLYSADTPKAHCRHGRLAVLHCWRPRELREGHLCRRRPAVHPPPERHRSPPHMGRLESRELVMH